jgi:hypothetical protein
MAQEDERLNAASERVERAEGFISDAEFREEYEVRTVRYLQAIANTMVALYQQNQVILERLDRQQ